MKKSLIRSLILLCLSVGLISTAAADPTVGKAAPDFTGRASTGEIIELQDYRGKIVVLEWTNHDCPYVRKHYDTDNMQSLQREAAEKGVVWLTVISSAPGKQGYVTAEEANRLTLSRDAAPTAVILDPEGEIGRLYSARTTPHMFVIDAAGVLVYMGGIDDKPSTRKSDVVKADNYVRAALDALLAGSPIETAVSRPYGCSVKY